jgi:hypothetical protein
MQCGKQDGYSITSSAVICMISGTVRPSFSAVLRLITNSNLVDCMTGRSPGLSPLRIRPAYWLSNHHHHRSDTESVGPSLFRCFSCFSHLRTFVTAYFPAPADISFS